jgi:hypothetical protein
LDQLGKEIHMKIIVGVVIGLLLGVGMTLFVLRGTPPVVYAGGTPSGNGDVNASGTIDIADAVYLLMYLFAKGPVPESIESAGGGLLATGQTLCYGYDEVQGWGEVPCASADWPGQDGFYGKGCPTADRYVDNQDGTVTDTCTGLMWQKERAAMSYTWYNALQYCDSLEFAGHSGWRLPNVRELQSIVDYGRMEPSSDPIFGEESGWYWSSSTHVYNPGNAWGVDFNGGGVSYDGKGYGLFVRAVHS